ncbi:MAG TPA: hypothetical protein VMO47_09225 [Rhodothermales bacterium]|nr:hypothetical protein [Rhodothermales bacterium]
MRKLLFLLAVASLLSCHGSGVRYARVTEMAVIAEPSNLLQSSECRALWGNIQRAGLDMDRFGENWNEVILDSAYDLIEKGCVQQRGTAD